MNIVPEIIAPIQLLYGHHDDTATTGQGCFMDTIAYLNGEPQITDQSPCVCVTVRTIVIFLNDFMTTSERQQLLPFVCRAMGSATEEKTEIMRRLVHVVAFADACVKCAAEYAAECAESAAEYAAKSAKCAAKSAGCAAESAGCAAESAGCAAESAAESAEYAAECAESAAEYAAKSAKCAAGCAAGCAEYAKCAAAKSAGCAEYAKCAARSKIISAGLAFLDAALPPLPDAEPVHVDRARELVSKFEALSA